MKLRPYQKEAVAAADLCLEEHGSALLHMATGTGKTVIFSKLIERRLALDEGRVMVLAHRTELLEQAKHRLVADTGLNFMDVGIEQATRKASPANRVVVASVQTMINRLKEFRPDEFGLIIVDEAHHVPAKSYGKILRHFDGAQRLGVTATPDRLDGRGLQRWFHKEPAYTYEIRDAIDDGYLVPIRAKMVWVDSIDLSAVRTTAGDLNEGDLEKVLMAEENLHGMVKPLMDLAIERPTLVFSNGVGHAYALQSVFNGYRPGCAQAVDGATPSEVRQRVLDDYRSGKFQFLINCALFTEGVDLPLVSCIAMARPTESRALYSQMVGRGTRLLGHSYEDSVAAGKPDLLVVDLVGNAGKHRLVCAMDILDGSVEEETRKRAIKKAMDDVVLIEGALEEAEKEVVELRRQDLKVQAEVKYRVVTAQDQFTILGVVPRRGRWGGAAQTAAQARTLEKAGIKGFETLDRGQASQVIDRIFERRRKGLCTLKQAKLLAKYGLNPDATFEEATEAISAIVENRWKLPPDLLTKKPHLAAPAAEEESVA